jgi:hypothetical protein
MSATLEKVLSGFKYPEIIWRPIPFLVLNDDFDGGDALPRITAALESIKKVGYGGVYLHPRPGLITEYFSARWFELIRHGINECGRLGLEVGLYDENTYPSGAAGGHVLARAPETTSRYIKPVLGQGREDVPPFHLALYRWNEAGPGEKLDSANDLESKDGWLAFEWAFSAPSPWHGEGSFPSLVDPSSTQVFIETTYDNYPRELSDDLWEKVSSIFTDEPHLAADLEFSLGKGLHLTSFVLGEFFQKYGYDLREHLLALYFDIEGAEKVRYDYYDLLHQLWVENWAKPLYDWCTKNKIKFTGHYLEHDWPCPYGTPGHMHLLAYMDWPGTDLLETFALRGHEFRTLHNLWPEDEGREPFALMFLRQCQSVANQLGKARVMNESWGAGGHDSQPADWMRIGRYLIVHGVNLLVPHFYAMTIRGSRKTDVPQFFSPQSPWYDYLKVCNDELARLCWVVGQGKMENQILVLDPLTTGYVLARKADSFEKFAQPAFRAEKAATDEAACHEREDQRSIDSLRRQFSEFIQDLSDQQFGFDLGDEYILEENASVRLNKLEVGPQNYDLIIWPEGMKNLRKATWQILQCYLDNGGKLWVVSDGEVFVDGVSQSSKSHFFEKYGKNVQIFNTSQDLLNQLFLKNTPRLQFSKKVHSGIAHQLRAIEGGEMLLLVNSHPTQALHTDINFRSAYQHSREFSPETGEMIAQINRANGNSFVFPAHIEPSQARYYFFSNDPVESSVITQERVYDGREMSPSLQSIHRCSQNVLAIDFCELQLGAHTYGSELVYRANHRYWRAHGFETNGLQNVIQYRNQLTSRQLMEIAVKVCYKVNIHEGVKLNTVRLAVECPELWQIKVNGMLISFSEAVSWRDDRIQATDVGQVLRIGLNTVEFCAAKFCIGKEIDQIYFLGEFCCQAEDQGFSLVPVSESIQFGSWKEQGMPFYDGAIDYNFTLPENDVVGEFRLKAEDWVGSFIQVRQGKDVLAVWKEALYRVMIDTTKGRDICLRVVGLPKNLLGPWHDPSHPRKRGWPDMWSGALVPSAPQAGNDYDLLDMGLFKTPSWRPYK